MLWWPKYWDQPPAAAFPWTSQKVSGLCQVDRMPKRHFQQRTRNEPAARCVPRLWMFAVRSEQKSWWVMRPKACGASLKNTWACLGFFVCLPQSSCCPGWARGLCSNIPPRGGCIWQDSSEGAARCMTQEVSHSVTVDSSQLPVTKVQIWCSLKKTVVTLRPYEKN